jgi:hypothetical protein
LYRQQAVIRQLINQMRKQGFMIRQPLERCVRIEKIRGAFGLILANIGGDEPAGRQRPAASSSIAGELSTPTSVASGQA